jgi:hypothetical protein
MYFTIHCTYDIDHQRAPPADIRGLRFNVLRTMAHKMERKFYQEAAQGFLTQHDSFSRGASMKESEGGRRRRTPEGTSGESSRGSRHNVAGLPRAPPQLSSPH